MSKPPLTQQGVTSLKPVDTLSLMQAGNARPMRLPVFVLTNYIKQMLTMEGAWRAAVDAAIAEIENLAHEDHTHIMSDVLGLVDALNGKVNNATLSSYVTDSALATTLSGYVTASTFSTAMAGKASVSHTHTMADVSGLANALGNKMQAYNNGILVTDAKIYSGQATTNALGNAVFNLTTDGTATGPALFNNVHSRIATANESAGGFGYTYTLSADRKTMTVNAKVTGAAVSLLGLNVLGAMVNSANTNLHLIVTGN